MPARRLAKFTQPLADGIVRRPRLFERLDALRATAAVWVCGPPGAGKTSLVSSWLHASGRPAIWFRVDADDTDAVAFFHDLNDAARRQDRPLPPRVSGGARNGHAATTAYARRYFRTLFATADDGTILVFDNLEALPDDSPLHAIIAIAAAEMPPGLQLVAISRTGPGVCWAPLHTERRLAVIDWDALRLQPDETATLAAALRLPAGIDRSVLHARSDGWAAGVVLLTENLRRNVSLAGAAPGNPGSAVFDYFASLVFDHTPAATRQVLVRLALLPRMTATMAQRFTGNPDAAGLLDTLARRNLFVTRSGETAPVYEFHALFRGFLAARAHMDLAPAEHGRLVAEAVDLLLDAGQVEDALPLLSRLSSWDAYAEVIDDVAETWVRDGRRDMLRNWLEQLPRDRLGMYPRLLYWYGVLLATRDPPAAHAALERSWRDFGVAGDRAWQGRAAAQIVDTLLATGENWRALDHWIDRLELALDIDALDLDDPLVVRAATSLLRARRYRRPHQAATLALTRRLLRAFDTAGNLAPLLDLGNALIASCWWRGDADRADRLIARLETTANTAAVGLRTRSEFCWWSGIHAIQLLQDARSEQILAQAQDFADEGSVTSISLEFVRLRAIRLIHARQFAAARHLLDTRITPHLANSPPHLRIGTLMHRAECELGLHRPARALDLIRQAEAVATAVGDDMHLAAVSLVAGRALLALGRPGAARHGFERVLALLGTHGSAWMSGAARVGIARTRLFAGEVAEALRPLRLGLRQLSRSRYSWGAIWIVDLDANLLATALRHGMETGYVRHLVHQLGVECPDPTLADWPWEVRIRALGAWEVERSASQRPAAGSAPGYRLRELLRALVAFGPEPVDLTLLADALWPDTDADLALNTLKVSVHRLRKWLGRDDILVIADGALRLDTARCWVDAWTFDRMADRLRELPPDHPQFRTLACAALDLYREPLFARDPARAWMLGPKARRHRTWCWMVRALGDHLELHDRQDDAVELYQRALVADPGSSDILACLRGRGKDSADAATTPLPHQFRLRLAG